VHVSDVVAHFDAAMQKLHRAPGAYVANVCTGRETSIRALAELIGGIAGTPPRLSYDAARTGDIRRSVGDPAFAIQTLGVTAATTLDSGLRGLLGRI
jgi:UDP-glucose 4-epimerase